MSHEPDTGVERGAEILRGGGLVAFPTETVYGLGVDATNAGALARLFRVKGRPTDHPVIVHLGDAGALDDWAADVTPECRKLTDACWPGPLTVVVARRDGVLDAVTGGRDTVGVRVPGQPLALALLRAFGGGVAAPSANRFGRVSPTTAEDVRRDLDGDVDFVLDGGPCMVGVESTIVDCSDSGPAILRLGGVPRESIEEVLGRSVDLRVSGETAAPGTRPSHYAPCARVVLVTPATLESEVAGELARGHRVGLLAMSPTPVVPCDVVVLPPPGDVEEYGRVLYRRLRDADRLGLDVLLAVPPAHDGIGAAVADRLVRASRGSA
jgi:L-threonylcarbamoyladenylate synthase